MKSKTKYEINIDELQKIFDKAKLGRVESFLPLGAGMYNAVYKVETAEKTYAIKIAPLPEVNVMSYEKDMLSTEIFWYDLMAKCTNINIPIIYAVDKTREIIPSEYYVMEFIEGPTLDKLDKTGEDKIFARNSLLSNIAQIHKVKSDKFGYIQNGLQDNWYSALKSFALNCMADLEAVGKKSKRGAKLLKYIEKHADLLKGVKGCMVNYDIWDLNIVATRLGDGLKLTWIDPERGFYGDPIFDFICVDVMKMSLKDKAESIEIYNSYADEKVIVDFDCEIRFAFALGYMALIQETEKFYRFRRVDFGWWFDVFSSGLYYKKCFKLLESKIF